MSEHNQNEARERALKCLDNRLLGPEAVIALAAMVEFAAAESDRTAEMEAMLAEAVLEFPNPRDESRSYAIQLRSDKWELCWLEYQGAEHTGDGAIGVFDTALEAYRALKTETAEEGK